VHMEPQINFGDLTPYLTYEHTYPMIASFLTRLISNCTLAKEDSYRRAIYLF
jgi:hypothetical protein